MLLASLEHPSIPTIYDYFYDDAAARFYLVMKYIRRDFSLSLENAPGVALTSRPSQTGAVRSPTCSTTSTRVQPIIYRDFEARQPDD